MWKHQHHYFAAILSLMDFFLELFGRKQSFFEMRLVCHLQLVQLHILNMQKLWYSKIYYGVLFSHHFTCIALNEVICLSI